MRESPLDGLDALLGRGDLLRFEWFTRRDYLECLWAWLVNAP